MATLVVGTVSVVLATNSRGHKNQAALASEMPPPPRAALDRPNVIVLLVDDLGYGDLGFTGHPTARTPTIDRLARDGKTLGAMYTACPVCSCSRASLLTGRQWPRMGIPPIFPPNSDNGLPQNETTIATLLRERAGCATGMAGKWHLGQRRSYLPGAHGFDEFLGLPYSVDQGAARASPCEGAAKLAPPTSHYQPAYPGGEPATAYLPLLRQSRTDESGG